MDVSDVRTTAWIFFPRLCPDLFRGVPHKQFLVRHYHILAPTGRKDFLYVLAEPLNVF
jgi:hypothetical protein